MLLLSNSGVFWNCIPSLCHAKWSQQSLLGSQLWIMKGNFVGFLQNLWRFLWKVSAFGGLPIATKIIKYHKYDQIFGKHWYIIYFEYIWITSCKGFGNYFFLSPGGTWIYLKIKAIRCHSHAGTICHSCCQQRWKISLGPECAWGRHQVSQQSWCLALGSSDAVPGPRPLPRGKTHTAAGVTQKGECDTHECQCPLQSGVMWPGVEIGTVRDRGSAPSWKPECNFSRDASQHTEPPGSIARAGKWHLGFPAPRSMGQVSGASAVTHRDLG